MLTLQDCDTSMKAIRSDVQMEITRQRISADPNFGPLKAKRHSVVTVRAKKCMYWLAQIFLLFQQRVLGSYAWTEDCVSFTILTLLHRFSK